MASSTWLTLAQRLAAELGLPQASSIASAQDTQTVQIGALLNRCGEMLMRSKDQGWSLLTGEWTLSLVPPVNMTGNMAINSRQVTGLSSTAGFVPFSWICTAQYFVQAPRIVSIDSPTSLTLDTSATSTQTGIVFSFRPDTFDIPPDLLAFVDGTAWDRTRRWQMLGPMTKSEDQFLRSGIIAPVPRRRFMSIGRGTNSYRIWPAPSGSDTPATLIFDYITRYWANDATGAIKPNMTLDTDTAVWTDDLMVMGAKWLFLQAKGFAFEDIRAQWQAMLSEAMAADGGAPELSLTRRKVWDPLDPAAVTLQVINPQ